MGPCFRPTIFFLSDECPRLMERGVITWTVWTWDPINFAFIILFFIKYFFLLCVITVTRYSWSIIIKFNCINSDFGFKHKLCFLFRLLSDPESLDRYLLEAGFEQVFHTQPTPVAHSASGSRFIFDRSITPPVESEAESPEVDRFTVQLKKDENGLGITIAGNR